ncbi:unnamed protein product, partial [Ectocarpus fasciculatus]
TTPSQRSPEVCISNRVPAVQAVGWTWKLSMDRLPQKAATEVPPGPRRRRANRRALVLSVVWPPSLKRLVFQSETPSSSWSDYTQKQLRRNACNRPIHRVVWPASLQQLS